MQWNEEAEVYIQIKFGNLMRKWSYGCIAKKIILIKCLNIAVKFFNYLNENEDELIVKAAEDVLEPFVETMRDDVEDLSVNYEASDLIKDMVFCEVEVDSKVKVV